MYNPNNRDNVNPPPPAQNYGAFNNNENYKYHYGQNRGNNNAYDVPPPNNFKEYNYNEPTNATANGGLYDEFSLNEFSSTKIRHGFIRKVYSILLVQLAITFGSSAVAVLYEPFNKFIINNYMLFFLFGMILSLPIMISMACYPALARKYPSNYLLLFVLTIGITLTVMLASAQTKSSIFYYSLGTTAVVVLGLTAFAFQTKWDFTGWHVYLFVAFLILFVIGIIGIFIRDRIFNLVFAGICAFLFSISIIVDTQLIIGGKHKKYEFSVDDYIFAALALYMDIINLFLAILRIFSSVE